MHSKLKGEHLIIHLALHNKTVKTVNINGVELEIRQNRNGNIRSVTYEGIGFIQQNPYKSSTYAERAKLGERITWGITSSGSWILIDDKIMNEFIHLNGTPW